MLEDFLFILKKLETEVTPAEIADILWLSQILPTSVPSNQVDLEEPQKPEQTEPPFLPPSKTDLPESPPAEPKTSVHPATAPAEKSRPKAGGVGSIPFRSPTVNALSNTLALGRAMKLLKRRVPSRSKLILDESATVRRIAEEKLWLPVRHPAPVRWLELMLVIDVGASMVTWQPTLTELQILLERHGAFSDVRVWSLVTDNSNAEVALQVGLNWENERTGPRSPKELINPLGQRLILVVSDCVSRAWHTGHVANILAQWGQHHPVTILQLLPERLWPRTALGKATAARIPAGSAIAPNSKYAPQIAPDLFDDEEEETSQPAGLPVPVINLEPQAFEMWTQVITGQKDSWVPGFVLPLTIQPYTPPSTTARPEPTAEVRVNKFFSNASPEARQLALLLSAVPVNLPIAQLIQHTMLPDSGQTHLAEVFLGGLFRRVPNSDTPTTAKQTISSDRLEYQFYDGVRELLSSLAPLNQTFKVFDTISTYITRNTGQPRDFYSFIADRASQGDLDIGEESQAFAELSLSFLRRQGGELAALADRLENHAISTEYQTKNKIPTFHSSHHNYYNSGIIKPDFFGGMEEELEELKKLIIEGHDVSIRAVRGMGGIGKTTLARCLAYDLENDPHQYFQVVRWLYIGQKPDKVKSLSDLARIARDEFIYQGQAPEELARLVKNWMDATFKGRTLFVFDDVWEDGIEAVRLLKQACPNRATILITTRSGSVGMVLAAQEYSLDKLDPDRGVKLLLEYLPNADPAGLWKLAEVLGGHPLAMTIAAKQVYLEPEHQQAEALLKHIAEYDKSLPSGTSFTELELDLDEEKKTNLTKALYYSYAALNEQEQSCFRKLGLLPYNAPFNDGMLIAIWKLGPEEIKKPCDRLRLLSLLDIDDSLVKSKGGNWYRQHPLVQSYARALLQNRPYLKPSEYYISTIEYYNYVIELTRQFVELPPEKWEQLEPYLAIIFDVGNELVTRTASPNVDDEIMGLGLRFASNIYYYLNMRREVRQTDWLEMGLKIARYQSDQDKEALFLNELANYYSDIGDTTKALDYYEQALSLSRIVGDRAGEASNLTGIGWVYSDLGEKARALEYYEQALSLSRAIDNRRGEANILTNIGLAYSDLGEKARALEYYEQALPLQRAVGDRAGEASTLSNIGKVYRDMGERSKALAYYEQALPLHRAVGDRYDEALTLSNIGKVYSDLGEKTQALVYYEQALPLHRAVGDRKGEGLTLTNIGGVYSDLGEHTKALTYFEQSLPLRRAVGDRYGEALTLWWIAVSYWSNNRQKEGLRFLEQSEALFQAVQSPKVKDVAEILIQWRAVLEQKE
jgi:tetratricopeptide (TPR) repeat protein